MPYSIKKAPKSKGYYVVDTAGKRYSIKPLPLARAKKQMTALHINTGHGLDDIVMPKKAFIKEHKKLLGVLSSQYPKQLKAEYDEQYSELQKVLNGKGKKDDDKFSLIHKLEDQFFNLAEKEVTTKTYPLIDALVTNIKNESEQFLSSPNATKEQKDNIRELLHGVLPRWIFHLASIPKEGNGKSKGGMMRVSNPLVPQVTPEQEAKAVIQRILDSANSARSMSITMKEGHKSMEKIMNESAMELFKAGKVGAVQYLNQLRAPYESRED